MQIYNAYTGLPENARGQVVAIGNFDGVHKGHQALLAHAQGIAHKMGKKLAVLTFEPHPRSVFRPDEPPFRITPEDLKRERLEACGVEILFHLHFDWDFASQSAEKFVQDILIDGLNASHIVVGHDFCFGQLRKGTPETIRAAGLNITVLEKICDDGNSALSSSRIRQSLKKGDIDEANAMLGWSWEIRGEVVKGDQRGRELGYPTANMALGDGVHPAYGIYAVLAKIEGEEEWLKGAANIGIRPMFEVPVAQVETFIFDFNREIYGKTLHVRPVKRLRGEARFNSLDELITQMNADCEAAIEILNAKKM
jgi:riboflavin kinase / FMN adenylyltransferase